MVNFWIEIILSRANSRVKLEVSISADPRPKLDVFIRDRRPEGRMSLPGTLREVFKDGFRRRAVDNEVERESDAIVRTMGNTVPPRYLQSLMDYCQADVMTILAVLEKIRPLIDIEFSVIRGRFLNALARVESRGISCDSELTRKLVSKWEDVNMS